jgi:hypothetical protein
MHRQGQGQRRSAIEAVIGHMKTDGRFGRRRLTGRAGDATNEKSPRHCRPPKGSFEAKLEAKLDSCRLGGVCSDFSKIGTIGQ